MMMFPSVLLAVCLLVGSSHASQPATAATQAGSSERVPLAGLGEKCGGDSPFPLRCEEGLECVTMSRIFGAQGTCRLVPVPKAETAVTAPATTESSAPEPKPGTLGGICGGLPSVACGQNLTCKDAPSEAGPENGHLGLAHGVCVPLAQIGTFCGGKDPLAPICTPNATCRYPTLRRISGLQSRCVERFAGQNQECGGSDPYALRCARGLFCMQMSDAPGAKSTCYKPWSGN